MSVIKHLLSETGPILRRHVKMCQQCRPYWRDNLMDLDVHHIVSTIKNHPDIAVEAAINPDAFTSVVERCIREWAEEQL